MKIIIDAEDGKAKFVVQGTNDPLEALVVVQRVALKITEEMRNTVEGPTIQTPDQRYIKVVSFGG